VEGGRRQSRQSPGRRSGPLAPSIAERSAWVEEGRHHLHGRGAGDLRPGPGLWPRARRSPGRRSALTHRDHLEAGSREPSAATTHLCVFTSMLNIAPPVCEGTSPHLA